MDHQGGGHRTGPRHALGDLSGPQQASPGNGGTGSDSGAQRALSRDPARGFPPARAPQPDTDDGYPQGNAYSPVSGYRPGDWDAPETLRSGADDGAGGYVGYKHFGTSGHTINPGSSLRLPTSDPTAESTYFSNKLGHWQHITTRKLDPAPLSVAELYPPGFTLFGTKSGYQRVATSLDSDCSLAVFGSQLQTSLQSGDCKQVARATYVSSDRTMMGTIGVVNLSTATVAQQAGQVSGSDNLIAPLTASSGPAKNMLNGTGVEYAEVKGHYLILMYAEFTNLKSPTATPQKQRLVSFAEGMFSGSANIALSHRMLTGKP